MTWDMENWDVGLRKLGRGTWEIGTWDLGNWDVGLGKLGRGAWEIGTRFLSLYPRPLSLVPCSLFLVSILSQIF